MPNSILQPSLAGGELAPSLWSRVDMNRYGTSLKTCRNFITQVYGGAKNRPGFRMLSKVKDVTKSVRLIPFVFSQSQAYVLELGDYSLRAYYAGAILTGVTNKPNNGTMVPAILGGGSFTLTASKDTFVPGDVGRKIKVFQALLDEYTITAYTDAKNVTATSTANLVGLTLAPTDQWLFFDNPVGTVVFETSTPWSASQLPALSYAQSADVITVCHPDVHPQDIRRLDDGTFQVVNTTIANGPFLDANFQKTVTVAASALTGNVTLTCARAMFKPEHVGAKFMMEQVTPTIMWAPGKSVTAGNVRLSNGKYYKAMATATTGTIPPSHYEGLGNDGAIDWLYLHSGVGYLTIKTIGTLNANGLSRTCTAEAEGLLPDGIVPFISSVTINSMAISPANPLWVRCTTASPHGYATDDNITYQV